MWTRGRFHGQWQVNILIPFHSLSCSLTEFEREKYATKRAGMGVRWDRSNSLGRTRNSVVTSVTSRFGATASHYHKQESPVTPSAQISGPKSAHFGQLQKIKSLQWRSITLLKTRTSIWFDPGNADPTLILDDRGKWQLP